MHQEIPHLWIEHLHLIIPGVTCNHIEFNRSSQCRAVGRAHRGCNHLRSVMTKKSLTFDTGNWRLDETVSVQCVSCKMINICLVSESGSVSTATCNRHTFSSINHLVENRSYRRDTLHALHLLRENTSDLVPRTLWLIVWLAEVNFTWRCSLEAIKWCRVKYLFLKVTPSMYTLYMYM